MSAQYIKVVTYLLFQVIVDNVFLKTYMYFYINIRQSLLGQIHSYVFLV